MISKLKKKIVFLTGTRADYGKLKPLITATKKNKKFHPIFPPAQDLNEPNLIGNSIRAEPVIGMKNER